MDEQFYPAVSGGFCRSGPPGIRSPQNARPHICCVVTRHSSTDAISRISCRRWLPQYYIISLPEAVSTHVRDLICTAVWDGREMELTLQALCDVICRVFSAWVGTKGNQGRSQDFIFGGINFRDLVSMAVISDD